MAYTDEKKLTAKDLLSGTKGWTEAEFLAKLEDFLKNVEGNGYIIAPTLSAFADYVEQPRADVHEWIRIHPVAGNQAKSMVADTFTSGAILKKYVPNATNFALKNICGWAEQPTTGVQSSKEKADEKKAESLLSEYLAQERNREKFISRRA